MSNGKGQSQQNPQGQSGRDNAQGQQKTFTVTNPSTGESRVVTQRQWVEEKLGQQGFEKPADAEGTGETASEA